MQFCFNHLKYYFKLQISFTKFEKHFHLDSLNDASITAQFISTNEFYTPVVIYLFRTILKYMQ